MARQLTPLGIVVVSLLKWVGIPLLVGFFGFKFIGPNIGSSPELKVKHSQPTPHLSEDGKKFQSVRENSH